MQTQVDKDLCTGCGICIDVCPAVFEMDDENQAIVIADPVPAEHEADCRDAAEQCPSEAIQIEEG